MEREHQKEKQKLVKDKDAGTLLTAPFVNSCLMQSAIFKQRAN